MKKLMFTTALAGIMMTGVVLADRPPGWWATGCDGDQYARVVSERTGETLYWTNSTCPAGPGATDVVEDDSDDDENGDEDET